MCTSPTHRCAPAARLTLLALRAHPGCGATLRVQIVSSSYAAAAYLHSTGYRQQRLAAGHDPCVLLLGSGGMRQQLEAVGLQARLLRVDSHSN